jgi:hypothetical protein
MNTASKFIDKGAYMNGGMLSAKHPGDTIACSECLDVLRCGDKERTCRELALICSAIEEDEETMVRLGLEGVHSELHRLLLSKDEDVSEVSPTSPVTFSIVYLSVCESGSLI